MDPLAHTLFGAALAEAGLRRASRGATAALLIGANLPDIDIVAQFVGSDEALAFRRGWTHGVLAMLVLPLLLAGALLLWHRWRRPAAADGLPMRARRLLMVACLAVWSHPLLDWLNTYGVRLLMPFDGRWFYGDSLFIVDPWLWLMLAAGVVASRARTGPAITGWLALAAVTSYLVLSRQLPDAVVVAWGIGLALIALLRWRLPVIRAQVVAIAGVAASLLYAATLSGLARHAEARALERFPQAQQAQASPLPAQPFRHRVVLVHEDHYRIIDADGLDRRFERVPMDAIVQRAFAEPSIRGFAGWARFLWWQVDAVPGGSRVSFHDLRYSWPGNRGGIGHAEVVVGAAVATHPPH